MSLLLSPYFHLVVEYSRWFEFLRLEYSELDLSDTVRMPSYSSKKFLEEYELQLDKEFEYDGRTAQWVPSFDGPRSWGEENASI